MIEHFIVASHDARILTENLFKSPVAQSKIPIHTFPGFTNIPDAYNFLDTKGKITCYVHHDVFLPADWIDRVRQAFTKLPSNWGVLGVAGVRLINGKKQSIGHIRDRGREWGSPLRMPAEVDTLDEMLLITKGDITFDRQFEQDFYGADICLQAREQGQRCFAIEAYCYHNSGRPIGGRTESFYKSKILFENKWKAQLPIATTTAMMWPEQTRQDSTAI